ncbi:ATP-dependent nuclease [Tenuifilum thalassicum]|uniref:AAA family ATPase n=1 Tax=Tenuifilum thalassicum TaxID=2590900 RepID=A0A7D4BEF1_9BACT|nr:AAA family ATPase [Tenuifilum thalassicum]QKG80623.1 AAA family ATPase [Tenuifilum thalassicum]
MKEGNSMYFKNIKIWNFRSIGENPNGAAGLNLDFNSKLNLLIGANDSGKTTIIDAIRYCLGTQTYDSIRLDDEDFYQNPTTKERAKEFKIEITFSGFSVNEAAQFLEYLHFNDKNEAELTVSFTATNKENRIITNLRAGIDEEGQYLEGNIRDLLRVTYLKPLRDAEMELSPGYRSRLYQILKSHSIFVKKDNEKHPLEKYFGYANNLVLNFFEKDQLEPNAELEIKGGEVGGKKIKDIFNSQTKEFLENKDNREPQIKIIPAELQSILRKLELVLEENKAGLGTLNLLYMAAELIHLSRENNYGLRLVLVEELEAHLHPQAQLRVLKSLLNKKDENIQYIFTTHSTLLGSSIPLEYIKLCFDGKVFSLDKDSTALNESDYQFLERFLDATKANLFFAKGVIIVEGDAENLIIPTIAEIIYRPLHKYGVSIVNVGSKALLRYANIFKQKNGSSLPIKVAIITDLDMKIDENGNLKSGQDINQERKKIEDKFNSQDGNIKVFTSPYKTLEFDIALGNLYIYMHKAIQIARKCTRDNWIDNDELRNILSDSDDSMFNEADIYKRAYNIYKPLNNNQASKSITAQWFAKLILDDKENVKSLIEDDYNKNQGIQGIKYIIDAIKHVTE